MYIYGIITAGDYMSLNEMGFKDYLIVFLKGVLLGLISMGIPGLSASTVGIIVGIYFLMVDAIANVFKDFKTNIKFLLVLILGYGIGAIGAAFSVTILFEKFPLVTTLVILGFIIGSIPDMFIKLKKDFVKPSCWIVFGIVLILILLYNLSITVGDVKQFPTDPNVWYLIKICLIGVVTSSTFIIPGVDFAIVLLSLGIYYPFMNMITDILKFGSSNYSSYILGYSKILLFYLIGYFVGIFLFSKLIKFLINKYYSQTQFASLAFIVAAPFIVIKSCIFDNSSFAYSNKQLILGIILLLISSIILVFIGNKSRKAQSQKSVEEMENLLNSGE